MSELDLPETRYARLGDITLAYQTMGSGAHDLIIIPGIISHVEFAHELPGYTAFLRGLSTFARVVTFDKRGQGLSDRVSDAPALDERMDDVRAIMDGIGSRRAALLGFSEGSPMSVLFATTYPERTSHLILLGGFPQGGYNVSDEAFEPYVEKVLANWGTGQMMKRVVGATGEKEREMALLGKFERLACSPGAYKTLMRMNQKLDVTSILPNVRTPTLVLHSRADIVVPIAQGRKFAAAIPHAKLIEYDDLPHGVWARNCNALIGDVEEFITGRREAAAEDADRVLATVLFTDIVDSTQKASEYGDKRWRELLDRHDHLAAQSIEKHRGRLVKRTGDGILATFEGPGRAVRCALALGSVAREIGLNLRAGLHTGEIEMRGDDIGGVAVHAAARVMAQSRPNEVLVSRVVTDLVAGAGLKFAERGTHELKGLPGLWDLFAANQ
jgi:class 3 adenylate cyclase